MQEEKIKSRGSLSWPPHKLNYGETDGGARFKAASHDSVAAAYSHQMTELISSTSSFD